MDQSTRQEIEPRKARLRAHAYLSGASRPVLISRAIVGVLILVVSLMVWWYGLG